MPIVPSSVHSIVGEMEKSIEFVSNNITKAEILFKEGNVSYPRKLLVDSLENVERTVSAILMHKESGGSLDSFSFKGRGKEYMYMISELGNIWNKNNLASIVRKRVNTANYFQQGTR